MSHWISAASLGLVLLSITGTAQADPGDFTILRSFPAPMPSPDGLELIDGTLWTTECTSEELFELGPERGEVLGTLRLPDAFIDHLAWDGRYLWGNDHHDKHRIHRVDLSTGAVVGGFDVPFRPMGMAWDGEHLWSMEVSSRRVMKLDPATGAIVDTLPAPGGNVCGIGWDGVCLWVSDLTAGKYYQLDPRTGEVVTTLTPPGGWDKLFTGFTWDGEHAWIDDENPDNPTIFEIDLEMPTSGPCAHPVDLSEPCGPEGPSCRSEHVCTDAGSAAGAACRQPCDRAAADCRAGYTCWSIDDDEGACVPDPPGGATGGFGEPCAEPSDCQSGVCALSDALEMRVCTETCVGGSCPEGTACLAADEGMACLPPPPSGGGCEVGSSPRRAATAAWLGAPLLVLLVLRRRSRGPRRAPHHSSHPRGTP